jgi:ABC-type antimicrobial peptide transport system ATPase subunit
MLLTESGKMSTSKVLHYNYEERWYIVIFKRSIRLFLLLPHGMKHERDTNESIPETSIESPCKRVLVQAGPD